MNGLRDTVAAEELCMESRHVPLKTGIRGPKTGSKATGEWCDITVNLLFHRVALCKVMT